MPLIQRLKSFLFSRHSLIVTVLFFLVTAALYGRAVFFDLTHYIDSLSIQDFQVFTTHGVRWWEVFLEPDSLSACFYRPLLNFSFAVDAVLGRNAIWFYHLTNLILHAISTSLVFLVLKEWGFSRGRALTGALIFLVHPVLVEAVVWIPGRTDSLLGIFCFAGFLYFLKYDRIKSGFYLALYCLCLTAALLVKETAIILGLMAVIFGCYSSFRKRDDSWRTLSIWTGIIVTIWLIWRAYVLKDVHVPSLDAGLGTLWNNLPALGLYLGKAFIPVNLSVFPIMPDSTLVYGWITLGLLLGILILRRADVSSPDKLFKISWACAWFVLFLLPSLFIGDLKFEYRIYVSLLGAVMLGLEFIPAAWDRIGFSVFAAAVIGIYAVTAWNYSEAYRDQWSFWNRAVNEAPHSAFAQKNLGTFYHEKGDLKTAFEYYQKAWRINPTEEMLNNNLGLLYYVAKDYDSAVEHFRKEIRHHSWSYLPYYNLSLIMMERQHLDDAARLLQTAVNLNSTDGDVYARLADVYLKQGRKDEARDVFHRMQMIGFQIPQALAEQAASAGLKLTSP